MYNLEKLKQLRLRVEEAEKLLHERAAIFSSDRSASNYSAVGEAIEQVKAASYDLYCYDQVQEAVSLADSENAEWVKAEKIDEWLDSWGTENEKSIEMESDQG